MSVDKPDDTIKILDGGKELERAILASRDDYRLLRDGKPATFATREEAQHVADIHEREGYLHSEPINDGYTWPIDPDTQEWLAARGRWPKPVNAASIAA